MTDEPAVRTAEPADGDRVLDVAESAMTTSYALSPGEIESLVEAEYGEDAWERKSGDEDAVLLVAELDGSVVGVIDAAADGEATIRRLYVDPEQRGLGVGTALVEAMLDELDDRNADPVHALVVADDTESGDFITGFGFGKTDERETDVGGVDVVEHVYTRGAEGEDDADDRSADPGADEGDTESGAPASDLSGDDDEDERDPSTGDPDDLPETVTVDGGERYLGDDLLTGTEGPFAQTYEDEAREEAYGYYCGNCGSTDVSVDSMDRLKCSECGNTHKADTEYDDSYL